MRGSRLLHAPTWLTLIACSTGTSAPAVAPTDTTTSLPNAARGNDSSIVLSEDESAIWLTSPDDDQVVELSPDTLVVRRSVTVDPEPQRLVWVSSTMLVVTHRLSTRLAVVDTAVGSTSFIDTPCGGTAGVVRLELDGPRVAVACPNDDEVRVVEVAAGAIVGTIGVARGPGSLAVADGVLAVAASRAGTLTTFEVASLLAGGSPAGLVTDLRASAAEPRNASQFAALVPGSPQTGPFLGAYQLVDNDGDRDQPPASGGYGAVVDGKPRIEPALFGAPSAHYARFDGGLRVHSGPSALAFDAARGVLWVAHAYTNDIVALDLTHGSRGVDLLPVVGTWLTNAGPRGIALSRSGETAFVDVGFQWSVARLELASARASSRVKDAFERTRAVSPKRYSPQGLVGRRLFHDATNIQLTPSGIVTCATCHPEGGADGLTWFLHAVDVPRKLRRTPPAWNAKAALMPIHWDGQFTDASVLAEATTHALMNGAGLLVDFPAIATYMAEIPLPPGRPNSATADGKAIFESRCAECHPAPWYTDGRPHEVVPPSADPDGTLAEVITPTLLAIRARAPFLHDGRAESLDDVIATHNQIGRHGITLGLTIDERAALVGFMDSL